MRRIPSDFLRRFRRHFPGPIILCGALESRAAESWLGSGLVDLAAFGVPFIANPDLPERMRRGWTLAQPKTDLFYGGGAAGYSDYPRFEGPA